MEPIKVTLKPIRPRVVVTDQKTASTTVRTGLPGPPGRQGEPGPRGPQGEGIPKYGSPGQAPVRESDGSIRWRDTPTVIEHGANPNTPRPDADMVIWRGTVEPLNWTEADIWHDTSGG